MKPVLFENLSHPRVKSGAAHIVGVLALDQRVIAAIGEVVPLPSFFDLPRPIRGPSPAPCDCGGEKAHGAARSCQRCFKRRARDNFVRKWSARFPHGPYAVEAIADAIDGRAGRRLVAALTDVLEAGGEVEDFRLAATECGHGQFIEKRDARFDKLLAPGQRHGHPPQRPFMERWAEMWQEREARKVARRAKVEHLRRTAPYRPKLSGLPRKSSKNEFSARLRGLVPPPFPPQAVPEEFYLSKVRHPEIRNEVVCAILEGRIMPEEAGDAYNYLVKREIQSGSYTREISLNETRGEDKGGRRLTLGDRI